MSISGQMTEMDFAYRRGIFSSKVPMWYSGDFTIAFGDQTYDGGYKNLDTGKTTAASAGSTDLFFNLQGWFGASFFNSYRQSLEPYSGLGVWQLNNKIHGSGSYTRETTYFYLPLGLQYHISFNKFTLVTGAQYNHLLSGTVKSRLSQASSDLPDIENTQSNGKGYKLRILGEWELSKWTFFAESYLHTWTLAESNKAVVKVRGKTGSFYEPSNETRMIGFNLGGRF
jgi:hypothetical protein